jgi:hypothetical protein
VETLLLGRVSNVFDDCADDVVNPLIDVSSITSFWFSWSEFETVVSIVELNVSKLVFYIGLCNKTV